MIVTDAFQRVIGHLVAGGTTGTTVHTGLVRRDTRPVCTARLSQTRISCPLTVITCKVTLSILLHFA